MCTERGFGPGLGVSKTQEGVEETYGIELFCDSPDEEEAARDLNDGGGEGASDPAE